MHALLLHLAFTAARLAALWTLVALQWGSARLTEVVATTRRRPSALPPRPAGLADPALPSLPERYGPRLP